MRAKNEKHRLADVERAAKKFCRYTLGDLARSGLNAADAQVMQLQDMTDDDSDEAVGKARAGYKIPYFEISGKLIEKPEFFRVRFTQFMAAKKFRNKIIERIQNKYSQPEGSGVRPYFSRCLDWQAILDDPNIEITYTEGEKKAYAASKAGFPTVGLGGVWSFRAKGELLEKGALLPDLIKLAKGRKITICFDSDRLTNLHIQHAEVTLATLLRSHGANVFIATISPHGEEKVGMDDLLVADGKQALKKVLADARLFGPADVIKGIREYQKANATRHANVGKAVVAELKMGGRFIKTDNTLFYFDNTKKILLTLDSERDRELRAFVDDRTGVTGACPEWSPTFERLADTATNEGKRANVYKLAHYDEGTATWYRAQTASKLIRATAEGWKIVDNGTDGVLIHSRGAMADLVIATRRSGRAAFQAVVQVPNCIKGNALTAVQAKLLWAIYVCSINFPELLPTRPIPLHNGPKGSGKTSGCRAVLRNEFGERGQVSAINPDKLDALQSLIINSHVACIDNIDGRHEGLQNLLATAATGGMVGLRTLYTTMDKSEFRINCFLMATSRDPKSFTRDDVVDRLLYFPCERREDFMAESEMIEAIDANRPKYWRWMLDKMPLIIKALSRAKSGSAHTDRMADFAKFALAVGPVLGYPVPNVRDALSAMATEKLQFQSDHSPVLVALALYVTRRTASLKCHRGNKKSYAELVNRITAPKSAAQLLDEIKDIKHDFSYSNAISFGQALRNDAPAISTRFKWVMSRDKRAKINLFAIAPMDGYPTWTQHEKDIKRDKKDEK